MRKKIFRRLLFLVMVVFSLLIVVFGIKLAIETNRWKTLVKDMAVNEESTVYDSKNVEIAKLGCERKTIVLGANDIPKDLKNAYISIEDERFYRHHGVDVKRTGAAICSYIFHAGSSSYGGSTITQQLVKNLTGDSTDSIKRKVKEWWKAWQTETIFSKDEILGLYLNVLYVGPNTYGVGAGAKYYFNKSVDELTLEECAFLAGINNAPNYYNPFEKDDKNDKINKRTKLVLAKMLELKYINQEKYDDAVAKVDNGLKFKKGEVLYKEAIYSYHTDALILDVTEDIAEKYNISNVFATNYLNMAGLTIKSTQNSTIQGETEKEFEKQKYKLKSKNSDDTSQAAMVIIDHKDGKVLACVGGLGKKVTARSLNRATQSIRQTGSSIKPLAVLAPGIDKKIITASTICDDTERNFSDGYHPVNYSNQLGKITVRRAVESSQNIPFVEMMQKIKPKKSIKYLKKMGITTLTKEDNTLVLSLGGLQKGISPLQMAAAYATIANDGQYIEPVFYNEVLTKSGIQVVKAKQKTRKVFSKDVAAVLKSILTQPVEGNYGTATYCKISGVDVAAKTGTTDENYDRWLCGFTPYFTAVTWYGFDINETINFNKKNPAGLLWANVMSRIHNGLKSATFDMPSSVNKVMVCKETGKMATTGCKDAYCEYFLWGTKPGLCDKHKGSSLNKIDVDGNNSKNNVIDIINGIVNEIDVVDPQESGQSQENVENKVEDTNKVDSKNNDVTNAINNNVINTIKNDIVKNTTSNSGTNNTNKVDKNNNTNTTINSNNSAVNSSGDKQNTTKGNSSSGSTNKVDNVTKKENSNQTEITN